MKGKAAAIFAVTLAASVTGSVPATAAPRAATPAAAVRTFGSVREAPGVHLAPTRLPHATVKNGTYLTNNWAGYAITARGGKTIPQVNADFTVPSVNCAESPIGVTGTSYLGEWAGFDGLVDNTVEQEGIAAYCTSITGPATYYAWYEMVPLAPVAFTGIDPGDAISVETKRVGSSYELTLDDITTGGGFSTEQACPAGSTCKDNSAEVITEDPSGAVAAGQFLADFGMDNQTGILAHTYNGKDGSFGTNDYWYIQVIQMLDPSGNSMATLSPMYGSQAFSVTWQRGD